ncbi:MAG TPA: YlxR family protein [Candidatus Eisenbacteria bacterium]|nr:YlxR family protein [Candidatus Eisenbacteria bacterium]
MPSRRHEPVRTCVGCREEAGKRGLIRLVRGPDGAVRADPTGRSHGRGAYLHPDPACLEVARRRHALERALRAEVPDGLWEELTAAV